MVLGHRFSKLEQWFDEKIKFQHIVCLWIGHSFYDTLWWTARRARVDFMIFSGYRFKFRSVPHILSIVWLQKVYNIVHMSCGPYSWLFSRWICILLQSYCWLKYLGIVTWRAKLINTNLFASGNIMAQYSDTAEKRLDTACESKAGIVLVWSWTTAH